jgi:hypothetical protein
MLQKKGGLLSILPDEIFGMDSTEKAHSAILSRGYWFEEARTIKYDCRFGKDPAIFAGACRPTPEVRSKAIESAAMLPPFLCHAQQHLIFSLKDKIPASVSRLGERVILRSLLKFPCHRIFNVLEK